MSNIEQSTLKEKLDTCAILCVETYNELLAQRTRLNEQLDNGFINMSKARSIMGCASLSSMQLPSEITPSVLVDVVESKQNEIDFEYNQTNFNLKIANIKKSNETVEETAEKKMTVSNIPLPSWFGFLTPMSLKSSQKSFCSSFETIKYISELQAKLQDLQNLYTDLLKQKC